MKSILFLTSVLFAGLCFVLTNQMSLQDEIIFEEMYIANVCSGAWPDYKKINPNCEGFEYGNRKEYVETSHEKMREEVQRFRRTM